MKVEQIHLCHDKLLPELLDLRLIALGRECLELLNTVWKDLLCGQPQPLNDLQHPIEQRRIRSAADGQLFLGG